MRPVLHTPWSRIKLLKERTELLWSQLEAYCMHEPFLLNFRPKWWHALFNVSIEH